MGIAVTHASLNREWQKKIHNLFIDVHDSQRFSTTCGMVTSTINSRRVAHLAALSHDWRNGNVDILLHGAMQDDLGQTAPQLEGWRCPHDLFSSHACSLGSVLKNSTMFSFICGTSRPTTRLPQFALHLRIKNSNDCIDDSLDDTLRDVILSS